MKIRNDNDWLKSDTNVFWGEIAPAVHVVQIYEEADVFLDTLAGFVVGGINAEECVIVIATEPHLAALENRLQIFGISIDEVIEEDRYIPLNAHDTLAKFMVNDWPDEMLF